MAEMTRGQIDSCAPAPPDGETAATRWGQGRRPEFIDFRARWDGRLNRSDLTAFFGISVPQASLDIARYLELAPDNLQYDRSARVYLATSRFRPLFPSSSASRYLNELLAVVTGVLESESSLLGWRPAVELVPIPGRALNADALVMLLRAVRDRGAVRVRYQSMSGPEPQWRVLTPHAFAHDGFRWHVRAYCHTRNDFRDFVIARMLEMHASDASGPGGEADREWTTRVGLVLAPHPGLSDAHRKVIELDYGMTNSEVELECRRALLFYVLRHLRLNDGRDASPEAQQVVLKNRETLNGYLVPSSLVREARLK